MNVLLNIGSAHYYNIYTQYWVYSFNEGVPILRRAIGGNRNGCIEYALYIIVRFRPHIFNSMPLFQYLPDLRTH